MAEFNQFSILSPRKARFHDRSSRNCFICQSTQQLICGDCVSKQIGNKFKFLKDQRTEAASLRQKLDDLLRTQWEAKSIREKKYSLLKEKNKINSLVSEIQKLTTLIHAKRIEVTEMKFHVEQRLNNNTTSRKELETNRTASHILHQTILNELRCHYESSMRCYKLRKTIDTLKIISNFRLDTGHSSKDIASIFGLPLPKTIALWPCIPASILGRALSIVCRLVLLISKKLNLPLSHELFPICPLSHIYGSWPGIGLTSNQSNPSNHPSSSPPSDKDKRCDVVYECIVHLLKPPWYCDNSVRFDDDAKIDTTTINNNGSLNHQSQSVNYLKNRSSDDEGVVDEDDDEEEDDGEDEIELLSEKEKQERRVVKIEYGDSAFSTAVTLIQTTVLNLCIRAQVPMSGLHPEAILSNLECLRCHLEVEVKEYIDKGATTSLIAIDNILIDQNTTTLNNADDNQEDPPHTYDVHIPERKRVLFEDNTPPKDTPNNSDILSTSRMMFEDWESIDGSVGASHHVIDKASQDTGWSPAWLTNALPTTTVRDLASNLKGYQQRG